MLWRFALFYRGGELSEEEFELSAHTESFNQTMIQTDIESFETNRQDIICLFYL